MSYSPITVAKAFTLFAHTDGGKKLTHMQLQKLTYIAHGYKLALTQGQQPLITDNVNAWKFGPVIPSLYQALKSYGNGQVIPLIFTPDDLPITPNDQALLKAIYDAYGVKGGVELSDLTHRQGTPWDQVWNGDNGRNYQGAIIPDSLICQYYTDFLRCGQSSGL
ncbi:hypothetical protein A1OS_20935 [Enterovibrio norvegicus]|uniref:Panacea domain-containing protein n=1 Tax=Enterovibrio norvegicus TaxID=188144 RepID=UPI0003749A09|nr:type II toxin-antitoxin system antitoxin SocA domain-containing protein [Enterovibrio norvegicus]OEE59346.1 hypothetical protein A1OS_20935 [Enterovibrio norvegicus]PMH68370.1 hypothetical protein BCU62_00650 [Enterovibrio norvegicus]